MVLGRTDGAAGICWARWTAAAVWSWSDERQSWDPGIPFLRFLGIVRHLQCCRTTVPQRASPAPPIRKAQLPVLPIHKLAPALPLRASPACVGTPTPSHLLCLLLLVHPMCMDTH